MPQSSSHFSSSTLSSSTPALHIAPNISPMSVSSPLPSIPSFDNGLDPAQASLNRLQQIIGTLDNTLRLPDTPRAFAVYLLGLVIVFTGAFMHVYVSAQIMQAQFTLSQLRDEYRAIEQQNGDIIFQIARDSNLARLHERVQAMGYVPVQNREYIFVPNEAIAQTGGAQTEGVQSEVAPAPEDLVVTAQEAEVAEPAMAVAPVSSIGSSLGGQVGRWEEFWSATLRAATGSVAAAPSANTATKIAPQRSQSAADPNFWAVWWEQASEQGAKLLDQVRGQ